MTPLEVLRQAEKAWREGPPEFNTFDAFWETVPLGPLGRRVWKRAFLLLDQSNGDFDRAIASALADQTSCVKCGGPLKHAVAIGMYCPAPDCDAIDDQRNGLKMQLEKAGERLKKALPRLVEQQGEFDVEAP